MQVSLSNMAKKQKNMIIENVKLKVWMLNTVIIVTDWDPSLDRIVISQHPAQGPAQISRPAKKGVITAVRWIETSDTCEKKQNIKKNSKVKEVRNQSMAYS